MHDPNMTHLNETRTRKDSRMTPDVTHDYQKTRTGTLVTRRIWARMILHVLLVLAPWISPRIVTPRGSARVCWIQIFSQSGGAKYTVMGLLEWAR